MKPPRPITIVLFVLLFTACGNHNNVSIGRRDPGTSESTASPASTPGAEGTPSPASTPDTNSPGGEDCDPNYSGCVPVASDVDCAGKGGNGPAYVQGPVRVTGRDIYGLDGDKNGIACE